MWKWKDKPINKQKKWVCTQDHLLLSQASRLASVSEKAHFERATTVRYWPSESRWTDEWRADQPIKTLVRHHQKGPGERSETKAALPVNNPSQVNLHKHLTSSKQILFTKIFPSIHHQTSPNTSSWFVPFKKFINVGLFFFFLIKGHSKCISIILLEDRELQLFSTDISNKVSCFLHWNTRQTKSFVGKRKRQKRNCFISSFISIIMLS